MTRRYDREYMSEVKDIMASLMTNLDEGTERDCKSHVKRFDSFCRLSCNCNNVEYTNILGVYFWK
jgi:hypothetical protein